MSYQIVKSDGTLLLVLADGFTDNVSSSLTFVGKNVASFGEIQNNNFLHLLENFSSNTEPAHKMRGQLWYDKNTGLMKMYDSATWQKLSILEYGNSEPVDSPLSTLWYNTNSNQLFIKTSSGFNLIAPEDSPEFPDTKFVSLVLKDTNDGLHPVMEALIDGQIQFVISRDDFITSSTNLISGIPRVYNGITLKNGDVQGSTDSKFIGTSLYSDNAGALRNESNTDYITASTSTVANTIVQRNSQGGTALTSLSVSTINSTNGTISGNWTVTDGLKPDTNSGAYLGTNLLRWSSLYSSLVDSTVVDADTVKFDVLTDSNLLSITRFDTDNTLSANSDSRLATQRAIKRYIDDAVTAEISARIAGDNNLQTQINNLPNSAIPSGTVFYTAGTTVPVGFLAASGQSVAKNTYPSLYAALGGASSPYGQTDTTFKLPDLRGEFIRGWDNGRGVDSGRALGSAQASQNLSHTHRIIDTSGTDTAGDTNNSFDTNTDTEQNGGKYVETTSSGGTEARPRNIALQAIIKI